MQHLTSQFCLQASNKENFPVLNYFLQEETKLRGLKYLWNCIEWQRLLSIKFDKRIDKKFSYLQRNLEDTVTVALLHSAVDRNFGGIPSELVKITNGRGFSFVVSHCDQLVIILVM